MDSGRRAVSGAGVGGEGSGGGATSPTTSMRIGPGSFKRKRSGAGLDSSPDAGPEADEEEGERRRQPGVKRACNECRQQKLRCDVVQDPFTSCSRCNRLKLECKIESNFKRVGKRSKHAEMERQIERLQQNLNRAKAQGFISDHEEEVESPIAAYPKSRNQTHMGSDEAVSSLLHLKQGGTYHRPRFARELGSVGLTEDAINHLFGEFFVKYHPWLPFLDPSQAPDQYYQQHPLLFWVIITVAARRYTADPELLSSLAGPLTTLLWKTISEVPNNYFVVKALCLICTWPLPTSTTSSDPTHILCGVIMKTATGIGLHRPNNTQDFSRVCVELNREQLHDRVTTWAVCNIVAQSIATGYGQPASTLYDWTLAVRPGDIGPFTLSPELEARLQIERFCDKVSKEMYSNSSDPVGVAGDDLRATLTRVYRREFSEMQSCIMSRQDMSPIVNLHLKAAGLHLRLSAFFDSSKTIGYMDDLMAIWRATIAFLDLAFQLEDTPAGESRGPLLYASGYIRQMVLAACFALLKLLSSFFAQQTDAERSRHYFPRTIAAIRNMSVMRNDLPWRLAELMVQLYNAFRSTYRSHTSAGIDDSLQLKVRCRMSMSLVLDSIWRWREQFQHQGRGDIDGRYTQLAKSIKFHFLQKQFRGFLNIRGPLNIPRSLHQAAAAKHPTAPDSSAVASSASSTHHLDSNRLSTPSKFVPPPSQQLSNQLLAATGALTPNTNAQDNQNANNNNGSSIQSILNNIAGGMGANATPAYAGEGNYEVFDPLSWMFDGLWELPRESSASYFPQILDAAGGMGTAEGMPRDG